MMAGEDIIQFIWKQRLYTGAHLKTTCGVEIKVLSPGEQNIHAGPDFFNARIRLEQLTWAGNVEVHQKASDWFRHHHHKDPAYNNVILHVVGTHDTDIYNSLGRRIPALLLEYPVSLIKRYGQLKKNEDWLPCGSYIKDLPLPGIKQWLNKLQYQRTLHKCQRFRTLIQSRKWEKEEAFYLALASGFGLPLNSLPFELLCQAIPFDLIRNLRENQIDLEALFFGHSGLLYPCRNLGPYPYSLWESYTELGKHLTVNPLPLHMWKFLRLRPASFPTLRISQFAATLHRNIPLADNILSAASLSELEQLLRVAASEYWDSHYLFGKCSPPGRKYLGQLSINTLIINVIIPFLFTADRMEPGQKIYRMMAEKIFSQLKAEYNQVILNWRKYGIHAANARESQALLQLFNVYCKQKRCLDCQIGIALLEAAIYEKK